jgi:glutathione peroxidase
MSIYSIEVKDIDGKDITLQKYEKRVMLIVNVASKCGYTRTS